jgi:hypothetical protein
MLALAVHRPPLDQRSGHGRDQHSLGLALALAVQRPCDQHSGHWRNSAYDSKRFYPDETYAREIMQLFSIGFWKLDSDGTPQKDAQGADIPTYSNEAVTNFARVSTGFDQQQERSNIEFTTRG